MIFVNLTLAADAFTKSLIEEHRDRHIFLINGTYLQRKNIINSVINGGYIQTVDISRHRFEKNIINEGIYSFSDNRLLVVRGLRESESYDSYLEYLDKMIELSKVEDITHVYSKHPPLYKIKYKSQMPKYEEQVCEKISTLIKNANIHITNTSFELIGGSAANLTTDKTKNMFGMPVLYLSKQKILINN